MTTLRHVAVFTVAYLIVALVMVYGLRLPEHLTGNPALVHEYYFIDPAFSLAMDFVFIALYYLFAWTIWNWFNVTSVTGQGLIFIGSTALLTTFFWFYFTRHPVRASSFFSRWFHGIGLRSVLYDVVLLGLIFVVYHGLLRVF